MYVIDYLNDVITNSQGQPYPLKQGSNEPLKVRNVVAQLIDATTVLDADSAFLLRDFAKGILDTSSKSFDKFNFEEGVLFDLLQEILNKAQLLVPIKAAVHAGIIYKLPVVTSNQDDVDAGINENA